MKYAYRIYRNSLNTPICGGTVTAEDMDSASGEAIKRNKVEVIHESRHGQEYHYFMLNGNKVGILIYVNPEEF